MIYNKIIKSVPLRANHILYKGSTRIHKLISTSSHASSSFTYFIARSITSTRLYRYSRLCFYQSKAQCTIGDKTSFHIIRKIIASTIEDKFIGISINIHRSTSCKTQKKCWSQILYYTLIITLNNCLGR